MSYCANLSVGVNFNLGFGLQPGNVIRNRVANANCLCECVHSSISGPELLCFSSTYTLQNVPAGSTVTWSVTGSMLLDGNSSGTGNSASLTPGSSSSGRATLIFTIVTDCGEVNISKDIWVGEPQLVYHPPGPDPCTANPYYSTVDIPGFTYTWSVDNPNVWLTSNRVTQGNCTPTFPQNRA